MLLQLTSNIKQEVDSQHGALDGLVSKMYSHFVCGLAAPNGLHLLKQEFLAQQTCPIILSTVDRRKAFNRSLYMLSAILQPCN